jgi:apolipoprotein D and lipocalin family protein
MPARPHALLFAALVALASCATPRPEFADEDPPPLTAVDWLDLDRYMGRWYVIANIPYFAERGNLAPYVEYSLRPDGLIDDRYTARDSFEQPPFVKEGMIEITNPITRAEGRITFLPPLWQDYAVLFVDEEYRYSIIGHPTREYCWLFAREPRIDDGMYQAMLAVARANGFDTSRIQKIPHRPEDLGAPGFQ